MSKTTKSKVKKGGQIDTYLKRLELLGVVTLDNNRNGLESYDELYNSGEYSIDDFCEFNGRCTL